jgi:hypothetical protein
VGLKQQFDTAPIVNDELARLGVPLPPEIAGPGPKGVDAKAQEILRRQGIQRFTEQQYRDAVREAIVELSDTRRRANVGEPQQVNDARDAAAKVYLAKAGVDTTDETYLDALKGVDAAMTMLQIAGYKVSTVADAQARYPSQLESMIDLVAKGEAA